MSRKIVHYIAQTLIVAALLVATGFVLRPLQQFVHLRMEELKHQVVLDLETATGRAVSYSSISPSIFRYIEVRDLVVYGKPGERETLVQIKRLKIYYDIFAVLRGNIAQSVTSISVENTHIVLDTRRDTDVMRFIESMVKPGRGDTEAPGIPRITFQGKNLFVSLAGPDGMVQADRMFFTVAPNGRALDVKWRGDIRLTLADSVASVKTVESPVSITATLQPSGEPLPANIGDRSPGNIAAIPAVSSYPEFGADATVVIERLQANAFAMVRQAFRLNYRNGTLVFRKVEDRAPIDLAGQLDLRNRTFSANFQTDGFVPGQFVTVKAPLDAAAPWLQTAVTGKANLRYSIGDAKAIYSADFEATNHNASFADLQTVRLNLQGNEKLATVNRFDVQTTVGSGSFTGDVLLAGFLPSGRMVLSDVAVGGMAPLDARLTVARSGNSIEITDPDLSYARAAFHDFRATLTPGSGKTAFAVQFSTDGASDAGIRLEGNIPLDGSPLSQTRIEGRIDSLPVARFYGAFRAVAPGLAAIGLPIPAGFLPTSDLISDSLVLDADFAVATGPRKLTVDAPRFRLYDTAAAGNNLALSATASNSAITVDRLVANYAGYSAAGQLDASIGEDGSVGFSGSLRLQNVPYSFRGSYAPGHDLVISESHGLMANVSFSRFNQFAFQVSGTDIPIPFDGRNTALTLRVSGLYTNPETWEVNVNNFSVRNLPFVPSPNSSFALVARVTPGRGAIESITYGDDASTLVGSGSVTYEPPAASGRQFGGRVFLQLSSQKQDETYRVDASLNAGALDGEILVRNLPFKRMGILSVDGGLDGQIRLDGTTRAPVIDAQLTLDGATYGGQPVGGSATFHWADNALRVSPVNISYKQNAVISANATADLAHGTVALDAALSDPTTQPKPLNVGIKFDARYTPPANPLDFRAVLEGDISADLGLNGLPVQQNLASTWQFTLTKKGKEISVGGGPSNSLNGHIQENGDFVVSSAAPLPIVFQADGRIKGDAIEANINNIQFNLSLFRRFLDLNVFRLTQGDVTGSLRINGSAADPDFYGTLGVADAKGQLAFSPDPLGPSKTFLVFEEKQVTLTRFAVPIGKGNGTVEGSFVMNRWTPESVTIQVVVPGDEGMRVDYTFGNVVVDGYTNGVVKIVGTPTETTVTGSLLAYQTNITLADIGGPVRTPSTSSADLPVHLDMTIESGKRVEFLWPTSTIPVLRGYARLGQSIHITLATDTGNFSLRGDVGIQSGEIFYFERSFYIKDGIIKFNENENYFDPRLTVNAEIREISNSGPARISLVATDERLSKFTPRFVSDPPMTDAQIAALLGGNFFGELGNDQNGLSSAVFLTSDLVGQFSIVRSFENMVRDGLSLDLFSVRTQLFSNLLRGAIGGAQQTVPSGTTTGTTGTSNTQYPLDNTSPSLGKYLDNTTVFLGKYLGTDLFLELLVQLQAQNPYSATEQTRSFGGLVINPEISLDWRTPFFDLQWSFLPQTPQTLFLTDNTISLSWGFTY